MGSLFSRVSRLDPGPIAPVASILTLGFGVAATFARYVRTVEGAFWRLLGALALGAGAEIVGIATGFPFGRYAYTDVWWPTVRLPFGFFPLLVPFAWLLMAGASRLSIAGRLAVPLGGLLAAGIDLAMEPVMAGLLHYWRWLERGPLPGGAPVANFLGWWGTATLAGLVLTVGGKPERSEAPRWVLVGFVGLIVGLGLMR